MKHLLLIVGVLLSVSYAFAQKKDSSDLAIRIGGGFVSSAPVGRFSSSAAEFAPMGYAKVSPGGMVEARVRVLRHWGVGIQFNSVGYNQDHEPLYNYMRRTYSHPGYYTTIGESGPIVYIGQFAGTIHYIMPTRLAEIEAYALIGNGHFDAMNIMTITNKKMNDNLSDTITLTQAKPANFFYPGVGVRANRRVWEMLFVSAGVQYSQGNAQYVINERHVDNFNNRSVSTIDVSQSVSAFTFYFGIQLGFRMPTTIFPTIQL